MVKEAACYCGRGLRAYWIFTACAPLVCEQILRKYHLMQLWGSEEGERFAPSSLRSLLLALTWFHITQFHPDFNKIDSQKHQAEGISKTIEPVHDFRVD